MSQNGFRKHGLVHSQFCEYGYQFRYSLNGEEIDCVHNHVLNLDFIPEAGRAGSSVLCPYILYRWFHKWVLFIPEAVLSKFFPLETTCETASPYSFSPVAYAVFQDPPRALLLRRAQLSGFSENNRRRVLWKPLTLWPPRLAAYPGS